MPSAFLTGGHGFLGSRVAERLRKLGWKVHAPTPAAYDVRDTSMCEVSEDVIIHCAARVGGIGANRARPAVFFADNMRMGLNMLDLAATSGKPIVMVGTTCSYPSQLTPPFDEEQIWDGYPEPTNAPYGVAKRALLTAARAYRDQFGVRVTTLILANLYGPGDANDLVTSHVIPAIARKMVSAVLHNKKTLTLWGDGSPTRDFLYVDDAARAITLAAESMLSDDPLSSGSYFNIGTSLEISIREVALRIAKHVGLVDAVIIWNPEEPNGQERRALDCTRFRNRTGWAPLTSLEDGLRNVVEHEKQRAGHGDA